jgi:hypothetical protein
MSQPLVLDGKPVIQNTGDTTPVSNTQNKLKVLSQAQSTIQSLKAEQNEGNCCWNGISAIFSCFTSCIVGLLNLLCGCCSKKEKLPPLNAEAVNNLGAKLESFLKAQEALNDKIRFSLEFEQLPKRVQHIITQNEWFSWGNDWLTRANKVQEYIADFKQLGEYLALVAREWSTDEEALEIINKLSNGEKDWLNSWIGTYNMGVDVKDFIAANPKHEYVMRGCRVAFEKHESTIRAWLV